MQSGKSKYIIDSDFVIDSENRIIYYPNGLWKSGYVLPDIDSVIKFRKIGYIIQWALPIPAIIISLSVYLLIPLVTVLLYIPLYLGALFLWRYIKLIKPLKKYEVCDEYFGSGNYLKDFVGSINGLLLWAIEILFLIFIFLGLYVLVYKPERQLGGIILVTISGLIAAFILYVIYLKYRIRAKIKLSK